jgi:hypothetical protein
LDFKNKQEQEGLSSIRYRFCSTIWSSTLWKEMEKQVSFSEQILLIILHVTQALGCLDVGAGELSTEQLSYVDSDKSNIF